MPLQFIAIIIGFLVLSIPLGSSAALAANNGTANSPSGILPSAAPPQGLGSIGDYLGKDPNESPESYEGLVGIDVFETQAKVSSGQDVVGVGIRSVKELSPADIAGIRSESPTSLAAAEEMGVGVLAIGALLAFPPALFAVGHVPKMNLAKNYDVIVAVDAVRTRSIADLETAFRKARVGETVYLTIIRSGRRQQLHLVAPEGFSSVP